MSFRMAWFDLIESHRSDVEVQSLGVNPGLVCRVQTDDNRMFSGQRFFHILEIAASSVLANVCCREM